jgi:exosortase A
MNEAKAMAQSIVAAPDLEKIWIRAAGVWVLIVLGLMALFWPTLEAMLAIWWHSPTFNHCMLILPIVGYLVWERRLVFNHVVPRPFYPGVAIVLLGSLGWLLGAAADADVVKQLSFVFMLQASVVAIFGVPAARAFIFPLAFLFFAVPMGEFLIPGLQNITAHITVALLKLSGLAVYSDGVFISVPNGDFHVAEACSGVRFLIASLPLGVLFANAAFLSWRRRFIVILLSVLIPIMANGMRAYGIIMIAYFSDNKYALGVDHLIYGWIFFAFVTLVFLSIGMLFMDRPIASTVFDKAHLPAKQTVPGSVQMVVFAAVLVLAAANMGPLYNNFVNRPAAPGSPLALKAPVVGGAWRMAEPSLPQPKWHPAFKGVDTEILQTYVRDDGLKVTLYIGYYERQRKGADILGFGNTVAAPLPWEWASGDQITPRLDGTKIVTNAVTITGNYDRRRVWYWYWVDNRFTANPFVVKILTAKSKLLPGRSEAAVIAVSTGDVALNERKKEVLADFLAHLKLSPPFS